MKKIIGFLMLITLFVAPVGALADDDPQPPQNTEKTDKMRFAQARMKCGSIMHRAPSNVFLDFYFAEGIVLFSSSSHYATLDVTVLDEATGDTWNGLITTDSPSISGPFDEGTYTVTCVNEQGQTFVGYFEL